MGRRRIPPRAASRPARRNAGKRPQDFSDIHALVDFNPSFNRELVLETLRLVETRGYHRGQNLEQKLEAMLRGVPT